MTATTDDYLETYLQDHRAGATAGLDLARRLAEENMGTRYEDFLVGLAQEIESDVDILEQVMDRFGVSKPTLKIAGGKVAERLGRLKPNEQLTGYSPLSRVLEIEGMRGGVQAKQGLWDSLATLAEHDDRLDPEQMAELQAKAQKQLDGLREQSRMAAHQAFVLGEDG
jgi:predicted DNA-binding ribbon-helix-helix protein